MIASLFVFCVGISTSSFSAFFVTWLFKHLQGGSILQLLPSPTTQCVCFQ